MYNSAREFITRYVMSWIDDIKNTVFRSSNNNSKHEIPEGVWTKCESCDQVLYRSELERNLNVCPKCGHHMRLKARTRIDSFLDEGGREELGSSFEPKDVLRFKDLKRYKDRYTQAQKSTGEKDALVVEKGTLRGIPVVCCAFEFSFMGGSMGSVVGARFCLAAQECLKENRALVCFSTSGGARMQESLLSLMQMAKTSAVLAKLSDAHLPFISVMSDPTMGGVSASLAMLGDINIAEPNALIGFAGPRVIEQTVREKLPEGFQHAEFLLEKGAIDMIVKRHDLRDSISELVAKMMGYELSGDKYVKAGTGPLEPLEPSGIRADESVILDTEEVTIEIVDPQVRKPRTTKSKSKTEVQVIKSDEEPKTRRRSSTKLKAPAKLKS